MLSAGFNEARWHISRALVPSSKGLYMLSSPGLGCHQNEATLCQLEVRERGML